MSLAAIIGVALVVFVPSLLPTVVQGAALFAVWTLGRRASLGPEVAACTGERKWLVWAWAPVVLLPFQFIAALLAVLTVWQQPSYDYKGPRPLSTS